MTARTIRWAANRPDGTPILIDGVVADVDEATGHATLDERAREVVDEVVALDVAPTKAVVVPTIDLASAVHQLIEAKHRAGIPVRSRLPKQARALKEPSLEARNVPGAERIDTILNDIYSAIQRVYGNTTGKALPTISVDELYAGPIGQALIHLLGIASGTEVSSTANLLRLIDELHMLLPRGIGENIGRSLEGLEAEALRRTVTPYEWISVRDAARLLGISQAQVMVSFSHVRHRVSEDTGEAIFYTKDILSATGETLR